MRADALNSHVYPVRMEMIDTKQIPIRNACSTESGKTKVFLVGKTLSQICSTDEDKSRALSLMKFIHIKVNQNAFTKS